MRGERGSCGEGMWVFILGFWVFCLFYKGSISAVWSFVFSGVFGNVDIDLVFFVNRFKVESASGGLLESIDWMRKGVRLNFGFIMFLLCVFGRFIDFFGFLGFWEILGEVVVSSFRSFGIDG